MKLTVRHDRHEGAAAELRHAVRREAVELHGGVAFTLNSHKLLLYRLFFVCEWIEHKVRDNVVVVAK